jgi:hypothetical protein
MTPKRGGRVAPPPGQNEYDVVFGSSDAAKGWPDLCAQAPGNALAAWLALRTDPAPVVQTSRQHPLRGALSTGTYQGRQLPQWQFEVTGAGRIWYLVDAERRRVYVTIAGTGHPKVTE